MMSDRNENTNSIIDDNITQYKSQKNLISLYSVESKDTVEFPESIQSKISSIYKHGKKEAAKKAIKEKQLRKLKDLNVRAKLTLKMNQLKSFSKITKPSLLPKSIRFLDYCFPYDLSYMDKGIKSIHFLFSSYEEFKRISKIEIDKEKQIYIYQLEEKYPTRQIWKSIQTIDTIKIYLKNLQEAQANELILLLDVLVYKLGNGWMTESMLKKKNSCDQRIYYMKLSDSMLCKIQNLPTITMLERFDLPSAIGSYRSICHNDKFSRLIGYTDYLPSYQNIYNGFHIYAFVYTKNWLNYYVKF